MTLEGNVIEVLTNNFNKELESNLDFIDEDLLFEEDRIRVQNTIIRSRAEMYGYISCLDDLDVFDDSQLNEMYDKVDKALDEKQEALDSMVAR